MLRPGRLTIKLFLIFLVLSMASLVAADMRKDGDDVFLSVPGSPWELKVPGHGLQLQEEKRQDNGTGFYYLFQDPKTGLYLSFYLEPAARCKTSQDCREMTWSGSNPLIQDPRDVERIEENGFASIKYIIPSVQGVHVNQLNYSAHTVRDGYWVDIHISKVNARREDETLLSNLLKSISLSKRPPRSIVTKSSERRFPLPDHGALFMTVPPTWSDQVRQPPDRLPPTIVFHPELGNAFRIMVTPIWPSKKGDPAPSDRGVRSNVERSAESVRRQAVESAITIRELKREGVRGYYFTATDKNSKPGEFKYMTQGTVVTGDLVIAFTILSNDGTNKVEKDAITMIGSVKHGQ